MKITVKEVARLALLAREKAVQMRPLGDPTDVGTPPDWLRIAEILENLPVELPEPKEPKQP